MKEYFLAIDIGASSGRHIIGSYNNGEVELEEVYRFKNGVDQVGDRLLWDVNRLFNEIKAGIKIAFAKNSNIKSLAIDTWGVDYVLLNGDTEILPCYAYRDERGALAAEKVHKIIDFSELYARTGIAYESFNSIYQLYDDSINGRLDNATDFLMLPEYFSYKLTGIKKKEWTDATTTGLISVKTGDFDMEIVEKLGLNKEIFKTPLTPPAVVGNLKPELVSELGGDCKVVLCASHDTASAVYGIPMEGNSPYISSGTWSLLGIKTEKAIVDCGENLSNEGGVSYYRHQKNIMGMWLVNRLKDEVCPDTDFVSIASMAEQSGYNVIFDVNDKTLFAPKDMKKAILDLLEKTAKEMPKTDADIFSSIYHSLAYGYAKTYREIENNTKKTYENLYIVGGGAKNKLLTKLTEQYLGKKVIALPIEATAIGNIKIQYERWQKNG
ncbi:MAG: rhamnulokinase [Clostridia bacterium]|nr:rhamnulokinase [Clostridia bacterium]